MSDVRRLFALVDRAQLLLNVKAARRDNKSLDALLDTLLRGVEQLEKEQINLEESKVPSKVLRDREDTLIRLRTSYDDLKAQHLAASEVGSNPSDDSVGPRTDAVADYSQDAGSRDQYNAGQGTGSSRRQKSVRFSESTDDSAMRDGNHILSMHSQIMEEQDDHLESLSDSISRQRLLSIQIGDELESQAELLDDVDNLVDRTGSRLTGAKKRLDRVAKNAKDNGSLITIAVLIVILVILVIVLK